jgi:hypothetical protein
MAMNRRQAVIYVHTFGRLEMVDLSNGGTLVNGVPLKFKTPTPVRRSDIISFACGKFLDWSLVPNPKRTLLAGVAVVMALLLLPVLLSFVSQRVMSSNPRVPDDIYPSGPAIHTPADSLQHSEAADSVQEKDRHIPTVDELWTGSGRIVRRLVKKPQKADIQEKADSVTDTIVVEQTVDTIVHIADSMANNNNN